MVTIQLNPDDQSENPLADAGGAVTR